MTLAQSLKDTRKNFTAKTDTTLTLINNSDLVRLLALCKETPSAINRFTITQYQHNLTGKTNDYIHIINRSIQDK